MTVTVIPSIYGRFQTYLQDWAHGICCGTSQRLAELVEGLQVSLEERGQMSILLHSFIYSPHRALQQRTDSKQTLLACSQTLCNTAQALWPHMNLPTQGLCFP